MWGHRGRRWAHRDRVMAVALTMYEDSLHPCGHPKDVAFNPDMDGWYEAEPLTCQACAAVDSYNQGREKPEPGEVLFVRNTMPAGVKPRPWTWPD
jgi:hypothetical protein